MKRLKGSLKFKTGILVVAIALMLSTIAVATSYVVYKKTMEEQYYSMTSRLAHTEAAVLDKPMLAKLTDKVMTIFRQQYAQRGGLVDYADEEAMLEYYTAYAEIYESEEYRVVMEQLRDIIDANDAESVYVVYMDMETDAAVYIADASDEPCLPGDFDAPILEENKELMRRGDYDFPAYITEYPEYGWLCSSAAGVYDSEGNVIASAYVDISMNDVVQDRMQFLNRLMLILVGLTVAASAGFIVLVNNQIVQPINRLAEITGRFVEDGYMGEANSKEEIAVTSQDEIGELYNAVSKMRTDIHVYMEDLTKVTAEKERIGAELNVATQIQADMLPSIFPAFPEHKEFDIYATMDPAKEVGGDFYDFFLIDEDHLAMVMADVSGKGVPAALFMVIAKTLIKNRAQIGNASPSKILYDVNNQLCEGNEAGLFVTVWLAIIDLNTGKGIAANAGHENPTIRRGNGAFELVKTKHSPAVACMEGMRFREHEFQMNPGDSLYVYTDGVPEATNAHDELFGTDRMLAALNRNSTASPEQLLRTVKAEIDTFVGEAPQFDDITMLCMNYYGKEDPNVKVLDVEATDESLEKVIAFVEEILEQHDTPMKTVMQIDLAVEEIFVNIAHYAYAPEVGNATVKVEVKDDPLQVIITFMDEGIPYDPLAKEDPDITLSAEERRIGGLGVFLVKKNMDDVTYAYEGGKNILTIKKKL